MKDENHDLSDEELLKFVRLKDKTAFSQLYNRYWTILFLQINKMVNNEDESVDLVHSIFEKIWTNFPDNIENFHHYLYQMGKFASINYINRSNRREKFIEHFLHFHNNLSDNLTDRLQYSEILKLLYLEIENLPPKTKEIFIRARINYEPYKSIAEDLNVSLQTVKTTVLRATKILRKKIPYIKLFFLN